MKGWIFYKRNRQQLTPADHGVTRLMAAAEAMNVELEVYRPDEFNILTPTDSLSGIYKDGRPVELPDFLIPRLGADTSSYALALIRQLELNGVYSANSAHAIALAKDKMRVAQLLVNNQLPTPKTMLLHFPVPVELVEQEIGFPLVIKNISGLRGMGVHLCETVDSFRDLLGLLGNNGQQYIVQRFISSSYGRDLRVFVMDRQVIGCMQRTAKRSFKANYSLGGDVSPFPLTDEVTHLSLACAELVGLDIAGIDLLFGAKGYFICEANSSPGFKGMELVTGDDVAARIIRHCMRLCT
ncbi:ATP-grasp domain-containing protein [Legionella sp. CNM-4043-24]|uniref:ATP-grasp domain-containing protein n=1 Tax=Legionella sp. CNM-4043-24 TaxID=3421646 RepID=UPI00403A9933